MYVESTVYYVKGVACNKHNEKRHRCLWELTYKQTTGFSGLAALIISQRNPDLGGEIKALNAKLSL